MFKTKFVEKTTTHILCSVNFFFENHAFYKIMCYNIVESGRPQMATWCTCFACWIPKLTNTNSEYVILIPFSLQQWLREHASTLRSTYTAACLVIYFPVSAEMPGAFQRTELFCVVCNVYPRTDYKSPEREYLASLFYLGARWGWVFNASAAKLPG
jgi:hypothetical protein